MNVTYFIRVTEPGNAFTTFKQRDGESVRVPLGPRRVGPFLSIAAAADWLGVNHVYGEGYVIETYEEKEKP